MLEYLQYGGSIVATLFANLLDSPFCLSDHLLSLYPVESKCEISNYITPRMDIDGKHDKRHPIMQNVKSLANRFLLNCKVAHKDTIVVARKLLLLYHTLVDWKNGTPAIAYRRPNLNSGIIVALNFFGASSDVYSTLFDRNTTDCSAAMVNAIKFAMAFTYKNWKYQLYARANQKLFTDMIFQ